MKTLRLFSFHLRGGLTPRRAIARALEAVQRDRQFYVNPSIK